MTFDGFAKLYCHFETFYRARISLKNFHGLFRTYCIQKTIPIEVVGHIKSPGDTICGDKVADIFRTQNLRAEDIGRYTFFVVNIDC